MLFKHQFTDLYKSFIDFILVGDITLLNFV